MDRYNFCVAKLFALFWDWSWPLKENGLFCRDLKLGLAKAGVSISFCTSGYLRVTGGYICRRPKGPSTLVESGGMLTRKILKF